MWKGNIDIAGVDQSYNVLQKEEEIMKRLKYQYRRVTVEVGGGELELQYILELGDRMRLIFIQMTEIEQNGYTVIYYTGGVKLNMKLFKKGVIVKSLPLSQLSLSLPPPPSLPPSLPPGGLCSSSPASQHAWGCNQHSSELAPEPTDLIDRVLTVCACACD